MRSDIDSASAHSLDRCSDAREYTKLVCLLIAKPVFTTGIVRSAFVRLPYSPLDNIRVKVIVWRLSGNIIRTAPC